MDLYTFRNTMRQWFRERVAASDLLNTLPLVVTNEGTNYGVEVVYLRQTFQMGEARVIGVGSGRRRTQRIGRIFVEVFGPKAEGEGVVSELATVIEQIFAQAATSATSPDRDITINEPHTFDRPEPQRYCQVVSVPVLVDHFS